MAWSFDNCVVLAKGCKNLNEFKQKHPDDYKIAEERKMLFILSHYFSDNRVMKNGKIIIVVKTLESETENIIPKEYWKKNR